LAIEKITMPQLGESVTEGTISKWLVSVGDHVNKYDPLAEVMTDKVNAEVPSSFSGTIKELIAGEDDTLPVGEVICLIEVEGTVPQKEQKTSDKTVEESASKTADSQSNKSRYSPAVMRLSQEHNINLDTVTGTGAGGRITRKDILAVIEKGGAAE